MITFTSKSLNGDELKATVQEAFIQCISNALNPLWGEYRSEYDEYETEEEKHRKFAENQFEDMIEIEIVGDRTVQINDSLTDEGYQSNDSFRLEEIVYQVMQKCSDLTVEGEGQIDYAYIICFYTISTGDEKILIEYSYDDEHIEIYDVSEDGISEIGMEDLDEELD